MLLRPGPALGVPAVLPGPAMLQELLGGNVIKSALKWLSYINKTILPAIEKVSMIAVALVVIERVHQRVASL